MIMGLDSIAKTSPIFEWSEGIGRARTAQLQQMASWHWHCSCDKIAEIYLQTTNVNRRSSVNGRALGRDCQTDRDNILVIGLFELVLCIDGLIITGFG